MTATVRGSLFPASSGLLPLSSGFFSLFILRYADMAANTKAVQAITKYSKKDGKVSLGHKTQDNISNRTIREKTKSKDIIYLIKKNKFKFAGLVIRSNIEECSKKLLCN